jgi:hypothetical protein
MVGSNQLKAWMFGVFMLLFCVVLSYVLAVTLRRTDHSSKNSYYLLKMIRNCIRGPGSEWAGRAIEKT